MTGDEAHGVPWLAGYLGAVLAASMTLIAGFAVLNVAQGMGENLGVLPVAILPITAATFFTAWLPLARRFCIRNVWYYLASGALTGLLLCPVAFDLSESGTNGPLDFAYFTHIMRLALVMVPAGIVGALVFWSAVGRFNPAKASPAAIP